MKTWDLNYINKLKKHIENKIYILHGTDKDKEKNLRQTLSSISYVIDSSKPVLKFCFPRKESALECLSDDAFIFEKFGHLCNYLRILQDMHLKYEILYPNKKKIHFTDKQLLQISNRFYAKVGGFLSKKYQTIAGRFYKTLSISEYNMFYEPLNQTLPIHNSNLSFISIYKNNGIEDVIALIHEAGHSISALYNLNILDDDNRYAFAEIETMFLELLTFDYLETSEKYRIESVKLRLHYLRDILYSANTLCLKLDILNEFNPLERYGIPPIIYYLKNELNLNKSVINNVLYDSTSALFNYEISFLIALELYYIYHEDKEKALNMLEKIVKCKFDSSMEYEKYIISLGIIPGEHLEEYIIDCFAYTQKGISVYEKTIQHR